MRKLSIALALIHSLCASVAYQHAATAGSTNTSFPVAFTPLVNPSIIGVCVHYINTGINITASDGTNGAYTAIDHNNGPLSSVYALYVKNTTTSPLTVTVTAASTVAAGITVFEFSGNDTTTPLGSSGNGQNLSSGASQNINTSSANISGSSGDAIVACSANYYSPTWTVGPTNPSGMAIAAGATRTTGNGSPNITVSYAILAGSYNAAVGNNPGTTTYGNTIGFQIKAAGGGGTNSLFLRSLLNGISTGGQFFANPLGRVMVQPLDVAVLSYRSTREYVREMLRMLPRRGALRWIDSLNGAQLLAQMLEDAETVEVLFTPVFARAQ